MVTINKTQARRSRDRDALESPAFSIPAAAASFDGFCAWALSPDRPRQIKLGYLGGTIYLEMPGHDPAIELPSSAIASLDGFCDWYCSDAAPPRGRFAYLDHGVLVDMCPEEIETHAKLKGAVYRDLDNLSLAFDLGEVIPDGVLFTNLVGGVSNEPDVTFISWATSASGKVKLRQRKNKVGQYTELRGSPDLVVEIVSQSSVAKDTRQLLVAYHRAGVSEYWLIDARGHGIDFQILLHRPDGYVRSKPRGGWHFSEVFGRWFRLTRRRNRAGRWQYRLEVKAE